MIFLHGLFKGLGGVVDFVRLHKHFRRAAPQHHQPRAAVLLFEFRDVVLDLQGDVVFGLALLHVLAVEHLHVFAIERGGHRLDLGQETASPRRDDARSSTPALAAAS